MANNDVDGTEPLDRGNLSRPAWWPGSQSSDVWLRRTFVLLGNSPGFDAGIIVTGGDNISIGDYFSMMRNGSLYTHFGMIRIGDRVSLNSNAFWDAADSGSISIGDDVLIGPNTVLRASNHVFASIERPINQQGHSSGRIVIGDDVRLGANVVVVAGVTIGGHAVVGAGAVVTRAVEPWTVVAGVPAREVSKRKK